jgi:hypothetical protein
MALKRTSTRETTIPLEADVPTAHAYDYEFYDDISTSLRRHNGRAVVVLYDGNDADWEQFMPLQDMEYLRPRVLSILLFIL